MKKTKMKTKKSTKKKIRKKAIRKTRKKPGDITPGLEAGPGISKFRLDQLQLADYNPRTIDTEAMEGLKNSLSKFGCVEPIVVNTRGPTNTIIGGNQRYKALLSLGITECLCVTINCSKSEERLLNLTLNNPKIQGQFKQNLAAYIEELQKTLPEDLATLDMRIAQLLADIKINEGPKGPVPRLKEEQIRAYKKTHILLSFDPGVLIKIYTHLEALVKEPGVEYEQCSN